jgi:excisionase family DNA binding protein
VTSLTIAEAAELLGVTEKTIRRRVHGGTYPGAYRDGDDPNSAWLIPVEDLEVRHNPSRHDDLSERLAEVEAELAEWRRRAEVAEAVADERATALDDLRAALDVIRAQNAPRQP